MLKNFTINSNNKISLKDFSPTDTDHLEKKDVQQDYTRLQERFIELQEVFYASKKFSLLIILQGMDCSGKDGTVKKALAGVNPSGFVVQSFKQPTPEELEHDYLWRAHKATPLKGNITVFNRSYYEDVLVTRVHETIDDQTAMARFKEITAFEKYLVSNGTIILKFFLHISKEFQQRKLLNRLETPEKHWKFSMADLAERKFWDEYQKCYDDVLSNCSTEQTPWYVVPADHRWFRDYIILQKIVMTLENLKLEFPRINGTIAQLIKEVKECN
ncbi:PPK2 family polyphosphate kinase [Desulfosporosinus sp. OT]|uniref:PPK2 family polyphosphate kinase n=1 Tax=Desulfosporosinus sp. OT TaxID=913865 RepID=UPI0002239BC5|nr:PPK2 family polyphosphate kinase [Desulfosporosinus sp. OT]EGW37429.1 polyphosphate kinase 2 family protein [Desulfosporosinus sp. OT]